MHHFSVSILLLIGASTSLASLFSSQCVRTVGRLACPTYPHRAKHVHVELIDEDEGPDANDMMDNGYTSEGGAFHLHGCANDAINDIDPVLVIHHNCTGEPHALTVTVASRFIDGVFNAHTIDLSSPALGESFRSEAYSGPLYPLCDQKHGHLHRAMARRRRVVRTVLEKQCLRVYGTLKCTQPHDESLVKNVWVRLMDEDVNELMPSNTIMDSAYTSENGNFHLYGCATDPIGDIDPVILVKHKCGGSNQLLKLNVPWNVAVEASERHNKVHNITIDLHHPVGDYAIEGTTEPLPDMCDDLHVHTHHLRRFF